MDRLDAVKQPVQPHRLVETISRLIKRGATTSYLGLLQKQRPSEVAHVLLHLKPRERDELFRQLYDFNLSLAALAVSELAAEDTGLDLLEDFTSEEISDLLQHLPADDAAHLLSCLPDERHEDVLALMQAERSIIAQEAQGLLQYPENTAGRIMTPSVFSLPEDVTVAEAVSTLQRSSDKLEMVFYLYVVDDRNHLVGVVALRQLLLSPPTAQLKRLMVTDVIKVHAEDDQEDVARVVAQFNLVAVPVVDGDNKLVGMVTVDDVIDVIREEATEDLFALAGVESDDRASAPFERSLRRRLPWLALSLGTALVSAFVVSRFQYLFRSELALAAMLPIFAAMGGNSATQSLTVVVRSLSLGEVAPGTGMRVFLKELMVGVSNGVVFGIGLFAIIYAWHHSVRFAAVVGIAMCISLIVAAVAGALSPLALKRLGIDPVLASSFFAIAVSDALGFLTYLALAVAFLPAR